MRSAERLGLLAPVVFPGGSRKSSGGPNRTSACATFGGPAPAGGRCFAQSDDASGWHEPFGGSALRISGQFGRPGNRVHFGARRHESTTEQRTTYARVREWGQSLSSVGHSARSPVTLDATVEPIVDGQRDATVRPGLRTVPRRAQFCHCRHCCGRASEDGASAESVRGCAFLV